MLQPKRTKYRKQHKLTGIKKGNATVGDKVSFGKYGLKAITTGKLTSRQIEAGRRAIMKHLKRGQSKLWIRCFPDKPMTKKPAEVRQGKGKGNVEYWVFPVNPGRVIYELDGVSADVAREALLNASSKLPMKVIFVERTVL